MSELIQEFAYNMQDKKEERKAHREEIRKQRIDEIEEANVKEKKEKSKEKWKN